MVKKGEMGLPSVLTAKRWGFYDVLFKGEEFKFQRPYGSYIMENILFKISFPAESDLVLQLLTIDSMHRLLLNVL